MDNTEKRLEKVLTQIDKVKELSDQVTTAKSKLQAKRNDIVQAQHDETLLFNELSQLEFNLEVEQNKLIEMARTKK